ncbi:hypothetical protein Tdes44962_MAKER06754 [Teratosphaeria destructans]|uniref:Uncharacterized protein n=1 Tax=Teratosphaeria destructans TaxID=418781 RepID=A0A9W7T1H2_9PEZI|nr:hypothetical protein Tdes44962_MAKER06754 [Teratosphaeria destructans]
MTGAAGLDSYQTNVTKIATPRSNGRRVFQDAHGNREPAQLIATQKVVTPLAMSNMPTQSSLVQVDQEPCVERNRSQVEKENHQQRPGTQWR